MKKAEYGILVKISDKRKIKEKTFYVKLKQLTILGAGLLGASIMKAAKKRGVAETCVAWSRSAETRELCRNAEYIDAVFETPEAAVHNADCVIACIPVNRIVPLLSAVAEHLKPGALVTDVGSTKASICAEAERVLPPEIAFVGSHPMAGSEQNGILAAREDLFDGRLCFVADDSRARQNKAQERALTFWEALGMHTRLVNPQEHDAIVAHVSHLPHSVAVALSATLAGKPRDWRNCGAGGLRDTTRVSAGEPQIWRAILEENRAELLPALEAFLARFTELRNALADGNSDALLHLLESASQWRSPLRG